MAADPQDAPRHAGQVVRRVLLRRNIAVDAETAQLVAAAVQRQARPPGHRAVARALPPPPASRCSDLPSAVPFAGQALAQAPEPVPGQPRSRASMPISEPDLTSRALMVTGLSCPAAASTSAASRRRRVRRPDAGGICPAQPRPRS